MTAPFRRLGPRPGFPCPAAAGMVLRCRSPGKGGALENSGRSALRGLLIGGVLLIIALLVVLLLPGN